MIDDARSRKRGDQSVYKHRYSQRGRREGGKKGRREGGREGTYRWCGSNHVNPQNLQRRERVDTPSIRRHKGQAYHQRDDLCYISTHQVTHELHDVLPNPPSLLHRVFNGGEMVVHNHYVGRFFRHVAPAFAHGNSYVRRAQGGGVVDTIAWGREGGREEG